MQAASTVRGAGISRSAAGFVIGLMAALVIGAAGGFTAKSLSLASSSGTQSVQQVAPLHQAPKDFPERAPVSTSGVRYEQGSEYSTGEEEASTPADFRTGGPLP